MKANTQTTTHATSIPHIHPCLFHYTTLHYTTLYCTTLHCTALHCTVQLYGFPPNVGAVGTAALLNVGASLGNLLKELRGQGYNVGGKGAGPGEGAGLVLLLLLRCIS